MTGTKVAILPIRYAILHLKTPWPVFEFANAHACFILSFAASNSLENIPDCGSWCSGLWDARGCSSADPSALEGPNVTFLLTRRPVLGRIRVA